MKGLEIHQLVSGNLRSVGGLGKDALTISTLAWKEGIVEKAGNILLGFKVGVMYPLSFRDANTISAVSGSRDRSILSKARVVVGKRGS